jgi:sugar lactone lactonase YvrE
VQKFDNDGKFLAQWGSSGEADGQFVAPFGIAVSRQGVVYVSDLKRSAMQTFDTNGTFRGRWAVTVPGVDQPQESGWLAADQEGNVYFPLAAKLAIEKFSPDGTLLGEFGHKTVSGRSTAFFGAAVDQAGNVYGTDMDFNRIIKYDKAGALVTVWDKTTAKNRSFDHPAGIAVDTADNLYVAEYTGRRLLKVRQP